MDPINVFKFCPKCSSKLIKRKENLLICQKCGYEFYINAVCCNAVIIENENKEILLTKRKFEPSKDKWDWPGGFINPGETLEESVIREIKEELGVEVKMEKFVGTYAGRYLFQGVDLYILGITVSAKIINGKLKASDDISEFKYFSFEEILKMDLAFDIIKQGITDYIKIN